MDIENQNNQSYRVAMFYPDRESIEDDDLLILIGELEKIPSLKENTTIDLILNSRGGSAYSAYKMLKLLRSKCSFLRVIIPLSAKSAATLLSLGADEIVMGVQSELGPLDTQIEHPIVEGIDLSALDGVRSINFLSDFATKLAFDIGFSIRSNLHLGRKDSMEMALSFANNFFSPIVSKLDPLVVNMCYRYLIIAEKLGRELLVNYMLKKSENKIHVNKILEQLIWGYPEHGYVIDADEARRLKLTVVPSSSYKDWNEVWEFFIQNIASESKMIELLTDKTAEVDEEVEMNDTKALEQTTEVDK